MDDRVHAAFPHTKQDGIAAHCRSDRYVTMDLGPYRTIDIPLSLCFRLFIVYIYYD